MPGRCQRPPLDKERCTSQGFLLNSSPCSRAHMPGRCQRPPLDKERCTSQGFLLNSSPCSRAHMPGRCQRPPLDKERCTSQGFPQGSCCLDLLWSPLGPFLVLVHLLVLPLAPLVARLL